MIYLFILAVLLVLLIKAGFSFEKMAAILYQWLPFGQGKDDRTTRNLLRLYPNETAGKLKRRHDVDRLKNFLVILFAGDMVALFMWISGLQGDLVVDEGYILRNIRGEGSRQITLTAKRENGEEISANLTVQPCRYGDAELEEMYAEMLDVLYEEVLGENASWDLVMTDLCFLEQVEGYPFTLSWESGDYRFISGSGKVADWQEVAESGEQSALISIACRAEYYDFIREHTFYARVCPVQEVLGFADAVNAALAEAESADPYGEDVKLPDEVAGEAVVWSKQEDDSSVMIFLLAVAAAVAVWVLKDRELQTKLQEKNALLESEYPAIISKLTLYLGAGMNLKSAWQKTAKEGGEHATGKANPVYEEMLFTYREMESGISEVEAYERFGKRIRLQRYIRLTTLLVQNLKKGNAALLFQLRQESFLALEERAAAVKKAGEEISTKLLFPMMLMMGMVMVLIMVPAFLSF